MKILSLLTITVWLSFLDVRPVRGEETNKTTVIMNYLSASADQVLDSYQRMTHRELQVANNVHLRAKNITFRYAGSPDAAPPVFEQALLKQGGILITPIDDKRSTVTIPNETNNVTYEVFKHDPIKQAPFAAYALRGADARVVEAQLLSITNASGQRICSSLSETGATMINFQFSKTNGVPYGASLEVK